MKIFSCVACFAWLVLALPAVASAQDKPTADVQEAEAYAEQAYEAYSAKKYAEAVTLYLKAYDKTPSADIIYNVAKIYDAKLKDRELAMSFYRKYITDPGADPERIKSVNERLSVLKEADTAANRPGTGTPRPTPGPGSGADSAGGGWSVGQVTGLVMMVAGGVAVAIGAGFGFAAMGDASRAKELCAGNACTTQEGVDKAERAKVEGTLSTFTLGIGAAVAVGGALLLFLSPDADASEQTGIRVFPMWDGQSGGLGVVGNF